MSALSRVTKFLLFAVNLLFLLCALAAIGYGAFAIYHIQKESHIFYNLYYIMPILLIILGSFTLLVSIMGIIGTLRNYYYLIIVFGSICIFLLLLQLIAALFVYIYNDNIKAMIGKQLDATYAHYGNDKMVKDSWDKMNSQLQCCGNKGLSDYRNQQIPKSCCPASFGDKCTKQNAYKRGCREAILNWSDDNRVLLYILGISFILLQVLVIILAFFFVYALQNDYETV